MAEEQKELLFSEKTAKFYQALDYFRANTGENCTPDVKDFLKITKGETLFLHEEAILRAYLVLVEDHYSGNISGQTIEKLIDVLQWIEDLKIRQVRQEVPGERRGKVPGRIKIEAPLMTSLVKDKIAKDIEIFQNPQFYAETENWGKLVVEKVRDYVLALGLKRVISGVNQREDLEIFEKKVSDRAKLKTDVKD